MKKYKYSALLRASKGVDGDKALFQMFEKYPEAYDFVTFFVGSSFAPRALEKQKEIASDNAELLDRVENAKIPVGINVHPTIGFFPPVLDEEINAYKKTMEISGKYNEGKLCSGNPETHKYVEKLYSIYASIAKGMIYVDDDVLVGNCFCPDCIKRFESLYNVFGSLEPTRENLIELFASKDIKIRKHVRESWIDFIALRSSEVLDAVERGVSAVDPTIEIGIMSCTCGFDGMDCEKWAKSLRGNTSRKLRWRPGGGVYNEFVPNRVLEKANRIGAQIRYIPDFVDTVEAELENFMGQILSKTPNFSAFEILMYLAVGCTGITYSGTCPSTDKIEEHEGFFALAQKMRATGNLMIDVLQRDKPQGVGFWWNNRSSVQLDEDNWSPIEHTTIPFAEDIYQVGIPIAYHNEECKVFLLSGSHALQMSDSEVLEVLKKGVLMDEKALDVLNSRGFGHLTGFKTGKPFYKDICEVETDCEINMPDNHLRYIYIGFDNGETKVKDTIYTLEKTNPNAVELTVLKHQNEEVGIGSGIFENELGGRVAVDSVDTFILHYSLARSIRIKNLISWLSKDSIAYIKSYHRIALWVRGNGAYLANMAMEDAKNVEIYLPKNAKSIKAWVIKGGEVVFECEADATFKTENGCTFSLPEIPITGSVLIEYK